MPTEKFHTRTDVPIAKPEVAMSPALHLAPVVAARRWRRFWLATLGLVLCFIFPLWNLARFAARSELYSYILLIPFISFYLVWIKRKKSPPDFLAAREMTAGFLTGGLVVLAVYWLMLRHRFKLVEDDYLAVMTISFLLFFFGFCGWFLGRQFLRANVFALGFPDFFDSSPGNCRELDQLFSASWFRRGRPGIFHDDRHAFFSGWTHVSTAWNQH